MLIDKYHKNHHIHAFYSVHSPTRSLSSTYVYSYHFYVCFINISYLYHFLSFKYISFLSFCDQSGSFCVIIFSRWYFQCVIHINWTASIISDLTLFNIGLYYSLYLTVFSIETRSLAHSCNGCARTDKCNCRDKYNCRDKWNCWHSRSWCSWDGT